MQEEKGALGTGPQPALGSDLWTSCLSERWTRLNVDLRGEGSIPSKEGRAHPRLVLGSWVTRNIILLSTSCPFRHPATFGVPSCFHDALMMTVGWVSKQRCTLPKRLPGSPVLYALSLSMAQLRRTTQIGLQVTFWGASSRKKATSRWGLVT